MRQMRLEGGFQGRTNKLVDGCYSFWQGGAFPLINQLLKSQGLAQLSIYFFFKLWQNYLEQNLLFLQRTLCNQRVCSSIKRPYKITCLFAVNTLAVGSSTNLESKYAQFHLVRPLTLKYLQGSRSVPYLLRSQRNFSCSVWVWSQQPSFRGSSRKQACKFDECFFIAILHDYLLGSMPSTLQHYFYCSRKGNQLLSVPSSSQFAALTLSCNTNSSHHYFNLCPGICHDYLDLLLIKSDS